MATMSYIVSLLLLFAFLIAGMLAARMPAISRLKIIGRLTGYSLYALLFFMGFRLGRNDEIGQKLGTIGIISLSFAVATVVGTILVLMVIYAVLGRFRDSMEDKPSEQHAFGYSLLSHAKDPLKLFSIVIGGFLIGFFVPLFPHFTGETVSSWLLYLLLFFIGIQLIQNKVDIKAVLAKPETLLLPVGTIVGSLAGGLVLSPLLGIPMGRALSLASGFGWYSLSGVLITDMGDPILGSAGFMANMLRETIALLIIPVLSRTRFPNAAIGVAGATSMDVTLPLIERTCGTSKVPLSIAHGAILSLLVPVFVPLFFRLSG